MNLQSKKHFIFDNDGILVHTEEHFFKANDSIFEEMGIAHNYEDFLEYTFRTDLGTAGFLKERGYSEDEVKEFKKKRNTRWAELIKQVDPVDQSAEKILRLLKENDYHISIVTNSNKHHVDVSHRGHSLRSMVNITLYRENYENSKPTPDGYLKALEISGYDARDSVVIEDSPRGISSAKAAGIDVIAVKNPYVPEIDLSESDKVIDSLESLYYEIKNISSE